MCEPGSSASPRGNKVCRDCAQSRELRRRWGQKCNAAPLGSQVANGIEDLSFNEGNKTHIINTLC